MENIEDIVTRLNNLYKYDLNSAFIIAIKFKNSNEKIIEALTSLEIKSSRDKVTDPIEYIKDILKGNIEPESLSPVDNTISSSNPSNNSEEPLHLFENIATINNKVETLDTKVGTLVSDFAQLMKMLRNPAVSIIQKNAGFLYDKTDELEKKSAIFLSNNDQIEFKKTQDKIIQFEKAQRQYAIMMKDVSIHSRKTENELKELKSKANNILNNGGYSEKDIPYVVTSKDYPERDYETKWIESEKIIETLLIKNKQMEEQLQIKNNSKDVDTSQKPATIPNQNVETTTPENPSEITETEKKIAELKAQEEKEIEAIKNRTASELNAIAEKQKQVQNKTEPEIQNNTPVNSATDAATQTKDSAINSTVNTEIEKDKKDLKQLEEQVASIKKSIAEKEEIDLKKSKENKIVSQTEINASLLKAIEDLKIYILLGGENFDRFVNNLTKDLGPAANDMDSDIKYKMAAVEYLKEYKFYIPKNIPKPAVSTSIYDSREYKELLNRLEIFENKMFEKEEERATNLKTIMDKINSEKWYINQEQKMNIFQRLNPFRSRSVKSAKE